MGCKNSKLPTPAVPKPEIPKPKKSHTSTPKPEIPKSKKSHTSTPKSKKLPTSTKRKNISEENIKTYQSAYAPNHYMDYSCTTPILIPVPET